MPIEIGPVQLNATGRVRTNFANKHLMNAHRFAVVVHGVERQNVGQPFGAFIDEISANVVASVMSSVAAVEAYVNEVRFEAASHFPHQPPELVASCLQLIERQSIRERLNFLSVLNARQKPDFGREPGQSVAALIDLRNALVHFQPEWPDEQEGHARLGKRLEGRFALSPFYDDSAPTFPDRCMSYGCARWAVERVGQFLVEFENENENENGWILGIQKTLGRMTFP
jgi:hypothetical protein